MKRFSSEKMFKEVMGVFTRFPVTLVLIIMCAVWELYTKDFFFNITPLDIVFRLGMILIIIAQLAYEQFFVYQSESLLGNNQKNENKVTKTAMRWILQAAALILTGLYLLYLFNSHQVVDDTWNIYSIPGIRTMILFFTIIVLLLWIPTVKTKRLFSETFLVAFKAFFSTLFFAVILYIGISAIFALFEFLFFQIMFDWTEYVSIFVFSLFAPIFFLILLGQGPLAEDPVEEASMPKFLYHLISYIWVPIMAILTFIIVLYITSNITGDFFQDNILETLILSYTIIGWILLILSGTIHNQSAQWFKRIFPYALIFVIVLQMISTFIQIQEVGVTHGRYLIILFGAGTVISAVYYLLKKQSLKWLPIVAVISGIIAFVPPFDAMSLSVNQQVEKLNELMTEHEMLDATGEVVKNDKVPPEDQRTILNTLDYLSSISALNQVSWLPEDYYFFTAEFLGFEPEYHYDEESVPDHYGTVYLEDTAEPITISDFDQFIDVSMQSDTEEGTQTFEVGNQSMTASLETDRLIIELSDDHSDEPVTFDFSDVLEDFKDTDSAELPIDELTFVKEVDDQQVQIVVKNLFISKFDVTIDFYVMF